MGKVQERLGSGGKKGFEKKGWEMITAWERLEKGRKRLERQGKSGKGKERWEIIGLGRERLV